MVHVDHQHVLGGGKPQEKGAQQRALRQVEGPRDLGGEEGPGALFAVGLPGEIGQRQVEGYRGRDHLDGAFGVSREGGAQGLVAPDDLR